MLPVAPGNRLYTAFPVRLMFVFPAICPREVENSIYKDKWGIYLSSYVRTYSLRNPHVGKLLLVRIVLPHFDSIRTDASCLSLLFTH